VELPVVNGETLLKMLNLGSEEISSFEYRHIANWPDSNRSTCSFCPKTDNWQRHCYFGDRTPGIWYNNEGQGDY